MAVFVAEDPGDGLRVAVQTHVGPREELRELVVLRLEGGDAGLAVSECHCWLPSFGSRGHGGREDTAVLQEKLLSLRELSKVPEPPTLEAKGFVPDPGGTSQSRPNKSFDAGWLVLPYWRGQLLSQEKS